MGSKKSKSEASIDADFQIYLSMFEAARDGKLHNLKIFMQQTSKCKAGSLSSFPNRFGQTPLVVACREGHVEAVEYLIDKCGADIELKGSMEDGAMSPEPATPLWCASYAGHLNVVKSLLSRGANINCVGASGRSVVYVACLNGNLEMVKHLVANGADMEAADINESTCLSVACHKEHYQLASYLIETDVNGRLILKSLNLLAQMFTAMLSKGVKVDFEVIMAVFVVVVNDIEAKMKCGDNIEMLKDVVALHLIGCITRLQPELSEEQKKSFDEAVKRYVSLGHREPHGVTPLHIVYSVHALGDGSIFSVVDVMKLLLDAGADPQAVDHGLNTPLHVVAVARPISLDVIRLLLDRGAQFDTKNAHGKCFLDLVAPEDRDQLNSFDYTTLKSLAADAVKKNDTDDQDELARSLSNVALVQVASGMKVGESKVEVQDVSIQIE